jgi:hypothetical protein
MTTGTAAGVGNGMYYVTATSSDPSKVAVSYDNGATKATTGKMHIVLTGKAVGSATVTFSLFSTDTTDQNGNSRTSQIGTAVATQSQTISVLTNDDIKDYTIDTVPNAIFIDAPTTGSSITDRAVDYTANPTVYGTTSTGAKVVLAGTPVIGASVDSGDFVVTNFNGTADAPGSVKVAARTLTDATKTGSSTNLAVTVLGADGAVHSVTTPIKSSTASPVAASIAASVATQINGISVSGDIVSLDHTQATYQALLGNSVAKYNAAGYKVGTQNVYIGATDQYGQTSMALSQFVLVASKSTTTAVSVSGDGTLTWNSTPAVGTHITVSGVTGNGLVKTIEIDFN